MGDMEFIPTVTGPGAGYMPNSSAVHHRAYINPDQMFCSEVLLMFVMFGVFLIAGSEGR